MTNRHEGTKARGHGVATTRWRARTLAVLCCLFLVVSFARADDFLLVRRSMHVQPIRLIAINDQFLVHLPPDRSFENVKLEECIALVNPLAAPQPRAKGLLILSDGQRL